MAGQRIDDHGSPFGKQWPLPKGAHTKSHERHEEGGHLSKYEDTDSAIVSQQKMNKSKAKGHDMKPGYRY